MLMDTIATTNNKIATLISQNVVLSLKTDEEVDRLFHFLQFINFLWKTRERKQFLWVFLVSEIFFSRLSRSVEFEG